MPPPAVALVKRVVPRPPPPPVRQEWPIHLVHSAVLAPPAASPLSQREQNPERGIRASCVDIVAAKSSTAVMHLVGAGLCAEAPVFVPSVAMGSSSRTTVGSAGPPLVDEFDDVQLALAFAASCSSSPEGHGSVGSAEVAMQPAADVEVPISSMLQFAPAPGVVPVFLWPDWGRHPRC